MRAEEHKYETAQQAAERLGITDSQVRRLCALGRLKGAIYLPDDFPPSRRQWLIPVPSLSHPVAALSYTLLCKLSAYFGLFLYTHLYVPVDATR